MLPLMLQLEITARIIVAFAAGIVIGLDRERNSKPAGIRTQMLIAAGSALLTVVSVYLKELYPSPNADPARLMAQIVTGIGFVGGGVILKSKERVYGVTTAATIWVSAAVGISIGAGFYIPAGVLMLLVLSLRPIAQIQYRYGLKKDLFTLSFADHNYDKVKIILDILNIPFTKDEADKETVLLTIVSYKEKNATLGSKLHANDIDFELYEIEE